MKKIVLEKAALELCLESSKPPLIFELPVEEGRRALDQLQDEKVKMAPATIYRMTVDTGSYGNIPVYLVCPKADCPNVIFYLHGAGWVFGDFHTHEKLVRELSYRTNSIVIFPEYTRSPEAQFPTALEQCYSVLNQMPTILKNNNINARFDTLTIAGDSVGGNLATCLTILSKYRGGLFIHKQLLYYPVTNDDFNTPSYLEFAAGYYLYRDGMKWFWDQYAPRLEDRNYIIASPLKASLEQLSNLPEAMILNGEVDVLRDEGEAYADKLREAGVSVTALRFKGMIHDFVMLNHLDETNETRAAMDVSTDWINRKNEEIIPL